MTGFFDDLNINKKRYNHIAPGLFIGYNNGIISERRSIKSSKEII